MKTEKVKGVKAICREKENHNQKAPEDVATGSGYERTYKQDFTTERGPAPTVVTTSSSKSIKSAITIRL